MRRVLLLILAMAAPAAADTLSCEMTRVCVQGGPCLRVSVPVAVDDAAGARPVLLVDGARHPAERARNFFGTVYHGWRDAELPASHPGELWVRPNGRSKYIRRADIRGVTIRTEYRGRCVIVPGAGLAGAQAIK